MTNQEIAWHLQKIAVYLTIIGEKKEKIQLYEEIAEKIMQRENHDREDFTDIPPNIANIIVQIKLTGSSKKLQKLQTQVPVELLELLSIPNITAHNVGMIYRELKVRNIADLEKAVKERKIRKLPKMGSKTELAILRAIKMLKGSNENIPLGVGLSVADKIIRDLSKLPQVTKIKMVGGLRRSDEFVEFVELLLTSRINLDIFNILTKYPEVKNLISIKRNTMIFRCGLGLKVKIHLASSANFGGYYHYLTGTPLYNSGMEIVAKKYGVELQQLDSYNFASEEELFKAFQMDFIEPELRDSLEIIELALHKKTPETIEEIHIKGDLHCHTNQSDGVSTLEELITAAKARNYQYLAITDHSKSLTIAGGLTEEELTKQGKQIDYMTRDDESFKVYKGIEVDILKDGRLDFDDSVLSEMELVVASIHTNLNMDKNTMTDRITTAIKNKHVNILAHPTGRIFGRRASYELDIETVLHMAVKTNTVLEINSSPDRLDLNYQLVRQAVDMGAKIAINTDCHDHTQLSDISLGVKVAKKAKINKEVVINTLHAGELQDFLNNQKK